MKKYTNKYILILVLIISIPSFASGIDESDFVSTIEKLERIYGAFVENRFQAELVFKSKWADPSTTAEAFVRTIQHEVGVKISGGLARHPLMTKDAFAGILCHELGHLIGGAPISKVHGDIKSDSVELQADYWSTAKCLRRYFLTEGEQNLLWLKKSDTAPYILAKCELAFKNNKMNVAICIRSALTSIRLIQIMEDYAPPRISARIDTPSSKIVPKTERYYTDIQCRLDTLFQGSLCNQDPDLDVKDDDENYGFCNLVDSKIGTRPLCWHAPGKEVFDQGETSYINAPEAP